MACFQLGITIDVEEEREFEAYNRVVTESDMEITAANIAGLTVECLANYVPNKYRARPGFACPVIVPFPSSRPDGSGGTCQVLHEGDAERRDPEPQSPRLALPPGRHHVHRQLL